MFSKPLNILLIEDDEVDIINVQRALRRNNISHPLCIARNGLEALQMLKKKEKNKVLPDVILLDLNMPVMGGVEFLKEIRNDEELKSLQVFVLTTSEEDSDKKAARNYNVAGYIHKPMSFSASVMTFSVLNEYWQLST